MFIVFGFFIVLLSPVKNTKSMKKYKIIILSVLASVLITACQKNQEKAARMPSSRLILVDSTNRTGSTYLIVTNIGHRSSYCNNACIYWAGQWVHVDCMGAGDYCEMVESVNIVPDSSGTYTATTTDIYSLTSEDFFDMPARSLCVQIGLFGSSLWLNIPAQLVTRDPITEQFTFTGLFYSDYQYYSNN